MYKLSLTLLYALLGFSLLLSVPSTQAADVAREKIKYKPVGETKTGVLLPKKVKGTLLIPKDVTKPYPAVIIVHGSGGIDGRGAFYAKGLNEAGIATFEIKMFSSGKRAKTTGDTWPHVYGALMYLARRDDFDPQRIGVMGFSWGGMNSLQTVNKELTNRYTGGQAAFAGHAPIYAVCWAFQSGWNHDLLAGEWTGAPVLFLVGEKDDYNYDDGAACRSIEQSLSGKKKDKFKMTIYPGATHGWDAQKTSKPFSHYDKYAHGGKGGEYQVNPDKSMAKRSRQDVVIFFSGVFGIK